MKLGLNQVCKKMRTMKKIGLSASKYHNVITEQDGILFHSKSEAKRYTILKQREDLKYIKNLRMQIPYILYGINLRTDTKEEIGKYIADFVYEMNDTTVVEDVKSPDLASDDGIFALKKKILEVQYGIKIKCIHPSKVMYP